MEMPKMNALQRHAIFQKTANNYSDNASTSTSDTSSAPDIRKKIKYGTTYQAAWGIFSEYSRNSTIHGIKYLGEQRRPILERLFWLFVFGLSVYACAQLCANIWNKWDTNPVIVSFAEKSTPVWQIPFPTVTVCPETKSRPSIFNFTDTYWGVLLGEGANMSTERLNYMEAVTQICDLHLTTGLDFQFENTTMNATKLIQALHDVAPNFNDTYFYCKWRNRIGSCDDVFRKIITEEGICYSFNSLNPHEIYREEAVHEFMEDDSGTYFEKESDWDLEEGYHPNAGKEAFPERVLAAGAKAGLFLLLQGFETDYDQLCRGPVQGFKILLHTPGEVPQVSRQYFRIPFRKEVLISIKPAIITTSDGLKHYHPSRRQCFYQRERYLRYFKLYTQTNCELECLANFTLQKCGCVHFSMPRTADTPVCGAIAIECLESAGDELLQKEFEQGLKTSKTNFRGETDCNCLPACTSVVYNAEISQADFDYVSLFKAFQETSYFDEYPGAQMSRLSIFFKEGQFLTSKRSELYGTTDFLAKCGGLLALCMGASVLSLIEVVYFFSMRLITNLKMRNKKRRELARLGVEVPEIVVDNSIIANQEIMQNYCN